MHCYSGLFFRICYAIAKHFRVIVTNIQLDWMDQLGMTSLAKVLKVSCLSSILFRGLLLCVFNIV
ncbi:hypothetical protein HanXRQr2_Chr13g0569561 [Helianthus annuus]|nr:hypothetical protein HanXRQr2_Chr13g0569561 [Helianthus annuus]KAJ0847718.1 hypothetical protein HanPSC8_Chr13g0548451 [Helianthus annuus]